MGFLFHIFHVTAVLIFESYVLLVWTMIQNKANWIYTVKKRQMLLKLSLLRMLEYGLHGRAYSQPPQPRPLRWAQRAGVSAAGSCSPAGQSAAVWRSSPSPDSSAECHSLPRWQGGRAKRRWVSRRVRDRERKTKQKAKEWRHKGRKECEQKNWWSEGVITRFVTRDRHELYKREKRSFPKGKK